MALRINDSEYYAIDAHSHLGRRKTPLGHGVASFLGDDLVRNLDEAGLDCAVAFPLGASYTDYSEANQIMAEEMAKHPKRIISFCRINPNFGPQASADALEHCLGNLKLKGIKLHPEIEFFDPNEAELMEPIYAAARRYHVPIIFHTGMSSKASPGVIAELAAKYKDVPVILGHMGVSEYVKLAVAVARQNENIFLETSVVGWMPLLLEAFRGVGTSKILFGSDHPYNPLSMEVEKNIETRNPGRQTQSGGLEKSFLGQFFITVEMGAESLIDVTQVVLHRTSAHLGRPCATTPEGGDGRSEGVRGLEFSARNRSDRLYHTII